MFGRGGLGGGTLSRALGALFASALLLGAALPANAADCGGPGDPDVYDGFAGDPAPSQINISGNCTIRNYPGGMSTNFSFFTQPGQQDERWLIIFDNVVHTGQMSCNRVLGHKIWFVNGSSSGIHANCQNLFIPVEKIDKDNPPGPPVASIGVPFTYSLRIPILFDPAGQVVVDDQGSPNDLHSITVTDDLNATGASLTYVSHTATYLDGGAPVPHTFSNAGGFLTFSNFPVIPADTQFVIEITVVLNDVPQNAPGTQFINTAKWHFGRLIDGVFYEPLPGEWGVTPPMTISSPALVMTKTGPATLGRTLNLGEWGTFGLDLQNTGLVPAWDVTIVDRLPDVASGGMCSVTPEILSARVFAADGTTPVPGKGPLTQGVDYTFGFAGAPTCELTLTMLTAAAAIGPNERLILTYRTQLDPDTADGTPLTNITGATQWFNDDDSNANRIQFDRIVTDGTPALPDHQDAHTVTAELFGYFFEKSVANVTTGVNPAATALPGERLRYTLRLQSTNVPLNNIGFQDDLGAMNPTAVFVPGSLTIVGSLPPGATNFSNPNGGTSGAGLLDIRDIDIPANSQVQVQFEIDLAGGIPNGTVVLNQADLMRNSPPPPAKIADSDDPNINGQADPDVDGDEDPTRIVIGTPAPTVLDKNNTQATAAIGETFTYQITVPATPVPHPMYDVRITDDLDASAADLAFVSAAKVSGSGAWTTPVNTGTPTNLVIEDPAIGIDIPAGEQVTIAITVRLLDTPTNVTGLQFTNTADYTFNLTNGSPLSQQPGLPDTTPPMTIVGPDAMTLEKSGPVSMSPGTPGTFTLDAHNTGTGPAWNLQVLDLLPNTAGGGTCDAPPTAITARVFEADGTTPVSGALVQGTDFSASFAGDPTCELTLTMLSAAAVVGSDQRLIVTYQTVLDAGGQNGAGLTNIAGAVQWFSAAAAAPSRREFTRTITDGTPLALDHEDAHTVTVGIPAYLFEKTVMDVTSGANPATAASPGDLLRYTVRFVNQSGAALTNLAIFDELDRLNTPDPLFEPSTLVLVNVPPGADISNTSATGGARGTGVVDVRNISVAAGATVVLEFEVQLASPISNGTLVTNQSALSINGSPFTVSDDPVPNGPSDPFVSGDEDPTVLTIASGAVFRVQKISTDLTGDPNVLLAGETLRYTITVKNIGTANATDAALRDAVPANTTYVAGSTTLNGTAVPDGPGGSSPLAAGILIHAPENPTPGAMRADGSTTTSNVATIVFDVVVAAGAVDGTVISNQGFVDAPAVQVFDQPSDDPDTAVADDPTRDVVGAVPLLFAPKSVAIAIDGGSQGIVDPLDTLRYTITVYNTGAVTATGLTVTDSVPANTTYLADTTTLNGSPVGQPDGGVSPLAGGIAIPDLAPGESAVIQFLLQVNAGVASGTLISNQAIVASDQLPNLPTDGDGNPATGPEPTVVVVGDTQALTITKTVAVVGGGAALTGSTLEYVVRVTNVSSVPAVDVVLSDDLDANPPPGALTLVAGSATLNGNTGGVSVVGSLITADYDGTYGSLAPGASAVLRFRAVINAPNGTPVTNTGVVDWNTPPQQLTASVTIVVGTTPGVGVLSGTVWHDFNFDNVIDSARLLAGLDRRAAPERLGARDRAHGCERRLPVRLRAAQRRERRPVRAALPRSGRRREHRVAGHRGLAVHERSAADHRHRGDLGRQPAEPEPADRPQRRGVQRASAHARGGCHRDDDDAGRHAAVGELLRGSGAAGPGDAGQRLLQVRRELLRWVVPARWCVPARGDAPGQRLRPRRFDDHPADHGPVDGRVLGADVPGRPERRRSRDARVLRSAVPDDRARSPPRPRPTTCTSRSTTAQARARRSSSTTTSRSIP